MSSAISYLIAGCIFLIVLEMASISAAPQGFVEVELKVVSLSPVQRDDENTAKVTAENDGDYPLIVLSRNERKQIARITADRDGKYRAELPPGDYVLDVEGRVTKRLHVKAQPFTVAANETVHVDMTIVTGFASE